MGQFIDLTGNKYGKLTVVKRVEDHIQKSGKGYVLLDAFYTAGYYGTLEAALSALNEIIIKDRLSKADYALAEAVAVIKECREEWEKLVEKIDEVTHG